MTDDPAGFAEFLAARYDEAEAKARAAMAETRHCDECDATASGKWSVHPAHAPLLRDEGSGATVVYDESGPGGLFAYLSDVDPAHRLADIALKRAVLAEHAHREMTGGHLALFGCRLCENELDYGMGWCATVRQLGTEFSAHPDYRAEWAPEGKLGVTTWAS